MKLTALMQGICRVCAGFPQGLTLFLKIGVISGRSMTKCKSYFPVRFGELELGFQPFLSISHTNMSLGYILHAATNIHEVDSLLASHKTKDFTLKTYNLIIFLRVMQLL